MCYIEIFKTHSVIIGLGGYFNQRGDLPLFPSAVKIIQMLESVFHTWFSVFPPNFAQVNLRVC